VDGSTFEGRKREVEARDVYDTERVRATQFQLDWQRVATKSRFRRLVSRMDQVRSLMAHFSKQWTCILRYISTLVLSAVY
jgi:hypothetical protein